MSLDVIHPEVLDWSSFTKKLLHSFQSEWAYKSVNSQRSCCRFLRRWHYNTEKKYYQIFADGVYKYGFCSTRSKWLTNPLLRRIYTSRWIRPPKRSFKSRLKNILGSIRNSLTWCLSLWNFGTICSPSALPLDWFSICNNFFSWAFSQELEFSLQTLHSMKYIQI